MALNTFYQDFVSYGELQALINEHGEKEGVFVDDAETIIEFDRYYYPPKRMHEELKLISKAEQEEIERWEKEHKKNILAFQFRLED